MTLTFSDDTETDIGSAFTSPPTDNSGPVEAEFSCKVCGQALTYSGRGRKPSRCTASNNGDPECIAKNGGKTATVGTRSKGSNEKLAKDAVAVLTSMHDYMAMGAMFMQLMGTASAIAQANENFVPRAEAALSNDPALARRIIALGSKGGKAMLLGAYVGFALSVAPVAMSEINAQRAARKDDE
jgi:hypothetical protein